MTQRNEAVSYDRLTRTDHDPQRPALSSRQAADRIGITPQAVIDCIKRDSIDGYCLPGPQRKRWFAYLTSVDAFRDQRRPRDGEHQLHERLTEMENALTEQRAVSDLKDESYLLLHQAAARMAQANEMLTEAYGKLAQAQKVAASFTQSNWVPAYPPGGG